MLVSIHANTPSRVRLEREAIARPARSWPAKLAGALLETASRSKPGDGVCELRDLLFHFFRVGLRPLSFAFLGRGLFILIALFGNLGGPARVPADYRGVAFGFPGTGQAFAETIALSRAVIRQRNFKRVSLGVLNPPFAFERGSLQARLLPSRR